LQKRCEFVRFESIENTTSTTLTTNIIILRTSSIQTTKLTTKTYIYHECVRSTYCVQILSGNGNGLEDKRRQQDGEVVVKETRNRC